MTAAWTYSGDPSASLLDEVRFLIGDTDSTDQLLQDAEIRYALAAEASSAIKGAIRVARALVMKFGRKASLSVGDLSIQYGQRADTFQTLVLDLESQLTLYSPVAPFVGGISVSNKEATEEELDRVKPAFRKGMHDNEGNEDSTTDTTS